MSPTSPAPHLVLRPGVRIARRDDRTLQIGLEPGVRHLVADTEATRALLDAVQRGQAPPPLTRAARLLRHELLERDLLVDAHLLDTLPREPTAAAAVAAVVAETGSDATAVLRRRAAATVLVLGPPASAARLTALLAPEGVAVHAAAGGAPDDATDDTADVGVVLALGEPERDVLDRLARRDLPHLVVAVVDGRVRVGPFVVPGRTACLRCLDAHHLDRDPRHPVLLAQYARLTGGLRGDGVPDAIPHTRWEIALATAADDVLRFLDARAPTTWSATLSLDGDDGPVRTPWRRHPRCGCSWGEGLAVG